jgi:monoamine oxidase
VPINKLDKFDTIVIGGGISGLVATWQLRSHGINALLLEARNRFGGRILTVGRKQSFNCDLGPSWFWPGQPEMAKLLHDFKLPFYEQASEGAVLFQRENGSVERSHYSAPMAGSLRIRGGITQLVNIITDQIDSRFRLLEHEVTEVKSSQNLITITAKNPTGIVTINANRVALALPPRLAANITFQPLLPVPCLKTLRSTPTWMAGHGKFFATYDQPFWRQQGLCGSVISQCGPLAEIHDASTDSGQHFALFGFSALNAHARKSVGHDEFCRQAVAQLGTVFGNQALDTRAVYFQDWSRESFTATAEDEIPPGHHPDYGINPDIGPTWQSHLSFISSESSFQNGGLLEGAVAAGMRYAESIVNNHKSA